VFIMYKVKFKTKLANILIHLAAKLSPSVNKHCFVKYLFNGWVIIDSCLIRQSDCKQPGFKNGFSWETWTLPDEYLNDLKIMPKE